LRPLPFVFLLVVRTILFGGGSAPAVSRFTFAVSLPLFDRLALRIVTGPPGVLLVTTR
jgi:hypothetical protein